MKSLTILLLVAAAGLPALAAAGPGVSNGHDLDALWARAEAGHDLAREDAVVLLDDLSVTVAADGTIATRLHTVVWIGTAQGIRHYADLRVPWNAATSTLDVELLRTWRDDRWWPDAARISETAVVHTLPTPCAPPPTTPTCGRPCCCTTASNCPASWRRPTPSRSGAGRWRTGRSGSASRIPRCGSRGR